LIIVEIKVYHDIIARGGAVAVRARRPVKRGTVVVVVVVHSSACEFGVVVVRAHVRVVNRNPGPHVVLDCVASFRVVGTLEDPQRLLLRAYSPT